jgi:hypothetical protein
MPLIKGVQVVAAATSSEVTCLVFYYGSTENLSSKSMQRIVMFKKSAEN